MWKKLSTSIIGILLLAKSGVAGTVLVCDIEQTGYEPIKILIDEQNGVVVYNYQYKYSVDFPLHITLNNDDMIIANDNSTVILITKNDANFAVGWITPFPKSDGTFGVFSNALNGRCSVSPFD